MMAQNYWKHSCGKSVLSQIFLISQNFVKIRESKFLLQESMRFLKQVLLFLVVSIFLILTKNKIMKNLVILLGLTFVVKHHFYQGGAIYLN